MKKVSVIIPAYNCENFIQKCIDSLENQTYKNIQIIIVNDGSLDNTLNVCHDIRNKYNNIIVLDKKNEGPGIARMYGLEYADGDYISFIDSDDYVNENFYLKLVSALEKENCELAECGYNLVSENGKIISECHLNNELCASNLECVEKYVKKQNTTNYLCNKVYKKSLFNDIEFVKLYASEDACVLLQLFAKSNKKITISDCLYNYVQTGTSLSRKPYNLSKNDVIKAGKYMYNFCLKHYPHLSLYYNAFICSYAAQCYAGIKYSSLCEKNDYLDEMVNDFKQYYTNKIYSLDLSKFRKLLIFIFKISPKFASYLYKEVFKK